MAWRKWLVRTLVFSVAGGLGFAGILYQRWTNPAAIREQIVERLQELLPGANITLDAANLRLFGGIHIEALRLSRRDDPDRIEFAYVPSAVIYHDKEQVLDGRLLIRKIELHRLQLHFVRSPDGRWNISGDLFSKPHPELAIPMIVAKDATFFIEDALASPSRPGVEIKVSKAVVINDPLPQVRYTLQGSSELAGPLKVEGVWQRTTNDLALKAEAAAIPVKPALVHTLAAYVPKLAEHAQHFEASARLEASIGYHPSSSQPWSHDVSCVVRGGNLRHPRIPVPVSEIEAALHCSAGTLRLEQLTGRLGQARVTLKGWARPEQQPLSSPDGVVPQPDALLPEATDFAGDLGIDRLPLTAELFKDLPQPLQKLNDEYSPRGLVDLNLHFSRSQGEWVRHCRIRPLDLSAAFHNFPYTLEHITGIFNQDVDTRRNVHTLGVDLTGMAGQRPVRIFGDVTGDGPESAVDITISGVDIVLDEKLQEALRGSHKRDKSAGDPELYRLARSFHPSGRVDFQAFIRREAKEQLRPSIFSQHLALQAVSENALDFGPKGNKFKNRYLLRFHDAALRYDVFPYPLENVSGVLDVQPSWWEFHDFVGAHKGGTFRARGRSDPTSKGKHLWVEILGQSALLDDELDEALANNANPEQAKKNAELSRTWRTFHPRGHIDFTALIDQWEGDAPEVDVTATAHGCAIRPDFFPYELTDLTGTFRYAKRWVLADRVSGRHGSTSVRIDHAEALLKPPDGYCLEMLHLHGGDVILNDELLRALPLELRKICLALQMHEAFDLALHRFVIDPTASEDGSPHLFWDGAVTLKNATVQAGLALTKLTGEATCVGQYSERHLKALNGNLDFRNVTILNQPLENMRGSFFIPKDTLDVLAFTGLTADFFGGKLYGETSLEFGPTMHYALKLSAAKVKLEEFGRANLGQSAPLSGLTYADLYLEGRGSDIENLRGHGRVDIPSGRLYNLPAFLGLLKIIDLRAPNNVFFDEAHAQFKILGPQVTVNRLDLLGNPFSLRGQGDMTLYGTDIRLNFYAVGARALEYLPPVIKEFPRIVSEKLWKIQVRGRLGDLKCIQEPMPVVVEPAKEFLQALGRRKADNKSLDSRPQAAAP